MELRAVLEKIGFKATLQKEIKVDQNMQFVNSKRLHSARWHKEQ